MHFLVILHCKPYQGSSMKCISSINTTSAQLTSYPAIKRPTPYGLLSYRCVATCIFMPTRSINLLRERDWSWAKCSWRHSVLMNRMSTRASAVNPAKKVEIKLLLYCLWLYHAFKPLKIFYLTKVSSWKLQHFGLINKGFYITEKLRLKCPSSKTIVKMYCQEL